MTNMTAAAPTNLTLTGAQWRALASHAQTEKTRYAMECAAHFTADDKSRAWLSSSGVVVATDGKRALYLPSDVAPTGVSLVSLPKIAKSRKGMLESYLGAALPDGSGGRHYPPALDVIPARASSLEVPTDSLRAIFAPFATDPDNDTVRCTFSWASAGIRLEARNTTHNTTVSASYGNCLDDVSDPIGLGARYVLDVCDAADWLGVPTVTIQAKDHRNGVVFALGERGFVIVMPRVL